MNKDIKKLLDKLLKENTENTEQMEPIKLNKDDTFLFRCTSCGQCCTKNALNTLFLKPYDLYNIAKGLKKEKINETIKEFCTVSIGNTSGIPLIRIKDLENGNCPFLEPALNGVIKICSINDFKPSVCKLYPLGRGLKVNKNDNSFDLFYFEQEINCGMYNKINKVENWIGSDVDNQEKMLLLEGQMFTKINEIINLAALKKLYNEYDMLRTIISKFYNLFINIYYCQYDIDKNFFEQLDENIELIIDICIETAVIIYIMAFNSILHSKINNLDTNKYIIDNVLADDFEITYKERIENVLKEMDKIGEMCKISFDNK